MKKKNKIFIAILAILVLFAGVSIFVSKSKFGVGNPLIAINGLYQISFTEAEYVELQENPKIIIAKPSTDDALTKYMESNGFSEIEAARMGSIQVFEKAEDNTHVHFSVNAYYSIWKWLD